MQECNAHGPESALKNIRFKDQVRTLQAFPTTPARTAFTVSCKKADLSFCVSHSTTTFERRFVSATAESESE